MYGWIICLVTIAGFIGMLYLTKWWAGSSWREILVGGSPEEAKLLDRFKLFGFEIGKPFYLDGGTGTIIEDGKNIFEIRVRALKIKE